MRHDEQEEKPFNASPTYEKSLIPNCKKGERIFDFGCGQADYVKKLRKKGYDIHGVELFYRKGNFIDSTMVHKMIDNLCEQLETKGLFDIVICDYVLNSVDSMTAENDVLTVVNAMCRMGGKIYFSGRAREKLICKTVRLMPEKQNPTVILSFWMIMDFRHYSVKGIGFIRNSTGKARLLR